MRFVWAVLAFVLAAVLIGAGIAQRTVFIGDRTAQAVITVDPEQRYTLIDGAVFNSMPGAHRLVVRGDGTVFAAYGRTIDMEAWLSDVDHNVVTMDGDEITSAVTTAPAPEPEPSADPSATPTPEATADPAAEDPAAAVGRNPAGSDLWLDEFSDEASLIEQLRVPDDVSVLIASDGTAPAPSDISLTWPISNATPWAGPLMVMGGILMAVGVLLYILGIRNLRRRKGPLRRGLPPLPETQPISIEGASDAGRATISGGRRSLRRGRAKFVVPSIAIGALVLSGCTPEAWPQFEAPTPTPTPSTTIVVPEGQQTPAVTEAQAERILTRISETAAEADTALDIDLAATRLDGPMLDLRRTNYTVRASDSAYPAPVTVPVKPYEILLPQAHDGWPRTVFALWRDPAQASVPPRIMVLTQADAWSDYKLSNLAEMTPSARLPDLPPANIGAPLVPPNNTFLSLAPDQLATAYADVIDNGAESEYAEFFDLENETFAQQIRDNRAASLTKFNETAEEKTGTLTFDAVAGEAPPVSIATLQAGAIVAVTVDEVEVVRATDGDAVIKLPDNPTARLLSGAEESAFGFRTVYRDQLFFYIPGKSTEEKIRLLAYDSDLITTEELSE